MKLNLIQYFLLLITVAIFAFLTTPIFRKIAQGAKLLDYPGGRKLQAFPVAYLGGLAVAMPITLSSLLVVFTSIPTEFKNQLFLGLIIPSLVIAFIGLLDDLYQLQPLPRFISQSGVAIITSIMLYLSDTGVKLFVNPWLNGATTTLWVVVIINALNFMDNMDGLATILSSVISISLFVLSYLNEQYLVAALCLAILGACFGFLFWNKPPASIYNSSEIVRVLVPVLLLAIPVIDIVQVVITRLVRRKSPFQGGRDHLSHLLLNMGLSETKVLSILTICSMLFALCGIFLATRI